MVEKLKAYITYSETDEIKALLLKERIMRISTIVVDGKKYISRKSVPDELLADLIKNKHAIVTPGERITYEGKKKIFGIPDTTSRTITIDGDKYIQIRILAENINDLVFNISEIKKQMQKYGIQEKTCIWNMIGKLNEKVT